MSELRPIAEARSYIEAALVALRSEPQQSFLVMRMEHNLEHALAALAAVQTVRLPPVRDLSGIDDGEVTAYDAQGGIHVD